VPDPKDRIAARRVHISRMRQHIRRLVFRRKFLIAFHVTLASLPLVVFHAWAWVSMQSCKTEFYGRASIVRCRFSSIGRNFGVIEAESGWKHPRFPKPSLTCHRSLQSDNRVYEAASPFQSLLFSEDDSADVGAPKRSAWSSIYARPFSCMFRMKRAHHRARSVPDTSRNDA
jgi:hypothetical protein